MTRRLAPLYSAGLLALALGGTTLLAAPAQAATAGSSDLAGARQGNHFLSRETVSDGSQGNFAAFGNASDYGLSGDYDGDGDDTPVVYRPSNRTFYFSDSNGSAAVASFTYGNKGDFPLIGDWDGDGKDSIGVYRPSTGTFYLSNNNKTAITATGLRFGNKGDFPLTGAFGATTSSGHRIDTIGVYRQSNRTFYLSTDNATAKISTTFGNSGDFPVIGDWDGAQGIDGAFDTIGVVRGDHWYISNDNRTSASDFVFQPSGPLNAFSIHLAAGDAVQNTSSAHKAYRARVLHK